jgi:hypothetical protein
MIMKMIEPLLVLVTLALIFAAGHRLGYEAASQAHYNHPACHPPLKP